MFELCRANVDLAAGKLAEEDVLRVRTRF